MSSSQSPVVYSLHPRLAWVWEPDAEIKAIQIQVSDLPEKLERHQGNFWDTGKMAYSDTSIQYAGNPLLSEVRYYWRVRVWDENDQLSSYSEIASWEMGLVNQEDWVATYLDSDSLYRLGNNAEELRDNFGAVKSIESLKEVRRARLYVECSQEADLDLMKDMKSIEGYSLSRVGDKVYYTFVLTPYLTWGQNCFILKGLPGDAIFRGQCIVEYHDGKRNIEVFTMEDIFKISMLEELDFNTCKMVK